MTILFQVSSGRKIFQLTKTIKKTGANFVPDTYYDNKSFERYPGLSTI